MKVSYYLLVISIMLVYTENHAYAQIYESINTLKNEWRQAGLDSATSSDKSNSYFNQVYTLSNSANPGINSRKVDSILTTLENRPDGEQAEIRFEAGIYEFDSPIYIKPKHGRIIFSGESKTSTTIIYVGTGKKESLFTLSGHILNSYNVDSLVSNTNTIQLKNVRHRIEIGDMVSLGPDRRLQNDTDDVKYNNYNKPMNNLYYQAKVIKVDGRRITIDSDLSIYKEQLPLDDLTEDKLILHRIDPVEGVGIENLTLKSRVDWNIDSSTGNHINILRSTNIKISDIISYKPIQQHVRIWESSHIEVNNSYFHEAHSYGREGGNGSGYGVSIGRSNHCLVENNRFRKLRHSISLASGSSFNVVGYNFSYQQFSDKMENGEIVETQLSDINLHGIYPYGNLIESNFCDEIKADQWHSRNGPYNTFLRNKLKRGVLTLENADKAIVIGNEAQLVTTDMSDVYEKYYDKLYVGEWPVNNGIYGLNELKSYYYDSKPLHIYYSNSSLPWPSIGPPVEFGKKLHQTIPARLNVYFIDNFKSLPVD